MVVPCLRRSAVPRGSQRGRCAAALLADLLTGPAALGGGISLEPLVVDRVVAVDADAVASRRDPSFGGDDVAQLADIARHLGMGNVAQQIGHGLVAGIGCSQTIAPERTAIEALRLMSDCGFRHLPVTSAGRIVGVVSRGDFKGMELDRLEDETTLWERIT